MSVEALCRQEAVELFRRGPKYWPLVISLYAKGLRQATPARVFRAAYFFCRHIDDVLDGDRDGFNHDPEAYTHDVLRAMESGEGGPEIVELYRFAIRHLVDMAKEGEDPAAHFDRVIRDAMLFDFERGRERRILARAELDAYYSDTFAPVMDLALMIAGSELRSADMPESVTAQGHLYSLRDLEDDLAQGIINIPQEELDQSNLDPTQPFTAEEVRNDPHLRAWMNHEIAHHEKALAEWESKLSDEPSKQVCSVLIKQLKFYCRLQKWRGRSEVLNLPVAVAEAVRLSMKYRSELGVQLSHIPKLLRKSSNLAMCYQGFSEDVSPTQARAAGRAAFLSCAYDVVSDWHDPYPRWRSAFQTILRNEVGDELAAMAMHLYDRDIGESLDDDGLERGSVAFRFVLEVMGLTEIFEQKCDIDDLGLLLQIVDDIIDLEDDWDSGDTNCLNSPRRTTYLRRIVSELSDDRLRFLFPGSSLLVDTIKKARLKAVRLLDERAA